MEFIWAAFIAAVPATIAALAAWRTARQVRTGNGMTLGQLADDNANKLDHNADKLDYLVGAFEQHCEVANKRFTHIEERIGYHEHLATKLQEGCGLNRQDG